MAKVKAIRFQNDFCSEGEIRFQSGKVYAVSRETKRCVELNFGEEVTVDESELSQPNPSPAERRAAADLLQQNSEDATVALSSVKAALDQANALIEQARAIVKDIAEKEQQLIEAAEEAKPAIQAAIEEATASLKALFA